MTENEKEMFTEVYEIIQVLDESQKRLIPQDVVEYIKANRSDTYRFKVNEYLSIDEQDLKKESWELLGVLCLEYLCDEVDKKVFYDELQINENNYQENLKKLYNVNVFENNDEFERKVDNTQKALIEKKTETWYNKLFSMIKKRIKN